ncbi:MAG: serine/threonine-protein phosphatase [Clostridia bacterium]|nr:serine/threonine-protein phosphatase [Clostridia bacterium]
MRFGNLVIYRDNVKRLCGMITGYTSPDRDPELPPKKVEGDISIGSDLSASTRIGKKRENQEDAVLIMKHKDNRNYKMMVVADGLGGSESGEQASYICVNEIREWFSSLEEDDFKNEKLLYERLCRKLDVINKKINDIGNGAATTFVCALVADKHTFVLNIGDSRAYMLDGRDFQQISTDDSYAQIYYNNGAIEDRDDMRFSKVSNMVTNSLGGGRVNITPNAVMVPNDAYDAILLFSDGVTDCLSDSQIFAVTKWTSPKRLAHAIVQKALRTESKREKKKTDTIAFYEKIEAGKDNTSAAVLINKRKKGDSHDER